MKKLEEQAEAATKAQQIAEEKAESAEAIRKVAEAEKIEAEDRKAQAEKELQEALATKDVEIKEADEKKLDLPTNSPFRNADAIPLLFPPPPPPSQPEDASESEDEDGGEDEDEAEILVRKPKDAAGTKSLPSSSQIMDLTQDDVSEGVAKETTPEHASSDVPQIHKSIDETLAEIDAELAMEKAAEVALQESAGVQTKVAPKAEEPQL
ncbi:methyl-CpG-binding domain-containing protein 10-like [Camellia sinensis]|uniref:methyl-CpG-binding domain-containing protein 10-like n=1 Tax=Camellia sinensis TaxID=4442 RepID=UPI001036DDF5|nr:methyl-CpG-binding domain-containing protein 10-like [Camellia sinensis]